MRRILIALVCACSAKPSPPPPPAVGSGSAQIARDAAVATMTADASPACRGPRTHVPPDREATARRDGDGDPLPPHAIARLGSARFRHGAEVDHVMFCGGAVVASDGQGFVHAWDPATGAPRGTWSLSDDMMEHVVRLQCIAGQAHAVTNRGNDSALDLATGSREVAKLWDLHDAVAIGPDDLLIARSDAIARWRCGEETRLAALDGGTMRFDHRGRRLVEITDDALVLFDDLAKQPRSFPRRSGVRALEWSDDDRRIIIAYDDGVVDVLDRDGTLEHRLGPFTDDPLERVQVDGAAASAQLIALGTYGGELLRFEARTGEALPPLRVVRAHAVGRAGALAFSEGGNQLAIGGGDHRVRVIDARATAVSLDRAHGHDEEVLDAVFSPDGTRIATASADNSVRVWGAASGAQLAKLEGPDAELRYAMTSVAWPAGAIVAVDAYRTLRRWNDRTFASETAVAPAAFSEFSRADDRSTLAATDGATWWLIDARTLALRAHGPTAKGSLHDYGSTTTNRAGDRLAFCVDTRLVAFAATGTRLLDREVGWCPRLALTPDGAWLATSQGALFALDRKQPPVAFPPVPPTTPIDALRFSPDGTLLATSSHGRLVIWTVATREVLHTYTGHDGPIRSIAWSPTGDRLVTTGDDLDALVWRLE